MQAFMPYLKLIYCDTSAAVLTVNEILNDHETSRVNSVKLKKEGERGTCQEERHVSQGSC